nr:hypothetical protein [Tanacetum cinerariifolium]
MANLSEDIQCAGFDTRPPMLHMTDFASWQQRICLYCRGKENGVNILKSIDEGPFQMGTFQETLAEGNEKALHLGTERPRVYSDLSPEEKERYNADIQATNIKLQRFPKDIYTLINHYTDANDIWDNVKMLLEGSELIKKTVNHNCMVTLSTSASTKEKLFTTTIFVTTVKLYRGLRDSNYDHLYAYPKQHEAHANENKMMLDRFTQHTVDPLALIGQGNNARGAGAAGYGGAQNRVGNANPYQAKQKLRILQRQDVADAGEQDNDVDEDVDEQPVQELALNMDNVFQADDCDVFDSDVDEAPNAQTVFMANLSSVDPVYDEADPSYDSDILSERDLDLDLAFDLVCHSGGYSAFYAKKQEVVPGGVPGGGFPGGFPGGTMPGGGFLGGGMTRGSGVPDDDEVDI